jgi:hypothetical protein
MHPDDEDDEFCSNDRFGSNFLQQNRKSFFILNSDSGEGM